MKRFSDIKNTEKKKVVLYQPVWKEFTGFGDEPDFVDEKVSTKIFHEYGVAMTYAKEGCPKGYTYA